MAGIVDREYEGFRKIFRDLRLHVDVGLKLYQARRNDSDARFHDLFQMLDSLLGPAQEHQQKLAQRAPQFDFVHVDGKCVKANGYRSMLFLLQCCLLSLHNALQKCAKERGGLFYKPEDHFTTIGAHCRAFQGLEILLRHAVVLLGEASSSTSELFNDGEVSLNLKRIACSEYICRDVFYGRCFGFQYPPNLRTVMKILLIGMASYECWYMANKDDPIRQLLQSIWKGSKYWQHPTQLGIKMDSLTQDCSVFFTKAFWSISEQETIKTAMNLISLSVDVSQALEVPAKDIKIQGSKGEVTISPPFSDMGYRPIPLLLVSYKWRQGQQLPYLTKKQPLTPSSGLIIHIHGGGFVAQSPKSHESYLRVWSRDLETPVVSIDYSLAPEAPFPRALNECVMAYAWILQNLEQLGTTGEHIVLAGDSAGGTFAITTCMKLKELGLRLPDRILSCYPCTDSRTSASPSRFMTLVDPVLPIGILLSCQQAYTGHVPGEEVLKMRRESRRKIMKARGYYTPEPDADSPTLRQEQRVIQKKEKKGESDSKRNKSAPPPRPPPPKVTPNSSFKSQTTSTTGSNDTDSKPSASKSKAKNTSASSLLPRSTLSSDTSPSGQRRTLEDIDLGSYNPLQASGSEPVLSFESPDQSTEGVDEADGSKKGKEKEGVKKHPLLQTLLSLPQEPLEEDRLSPAEIDQLIGEILKSFEDPEVTKDPLMSPALAPDKMLIGLPIVHLVACSLDPLLDDAIIMAQRLKSVGQPVTLNVMDNIPHGFLNFATTGNSDLQAAFKLCLIYLRQGLALKSAI